MVVLVVSVLSACVETEPGAGPVARRGILGGVPDTDHPAVAFTLDEASGTSCSGALIAPRLVALPSFCDTGAGQLRIFFGQDVSSGEGSIGVTELVVHPEADPGVSDSPLIAIAELEEDAPDGVTPIPVLPEALGLTDADEDTTATFVGYGVTRPEGGGEGVRRQVEAPIVDVCAEGGTCELATAGHFVVDSTGGGPCSGDGPAYIDREATEYLAGLTIYGEPGCATSWVLALSSQHAFIDEVVAAHAAGDGDADADGDVDGDVDGDADADADADVDGDAEADADEQVDGDVALDAASDADQGEAGGDDGCECSAASARSGRGSAGLLLVAAIAVALGRRRARV
jgi:hypothetical protein